jgi:hypothetical protein
MLDRQSQIRTLLPVLPDSHGTVSVTTPGSARASNVRFATQQARRRAAATLSTHASATVVGEVECRLCAGRPTLRRPQQRLDRVPVAAVWRARRRTTAHKQDVHG